TENIAQLNQEIVEREKAEKAHLQVVDKLKEEMGHREQAQVELGQQSALLRSFLDASPDLVYYRNEDNEFSGCNRAMELLTG
ncbi:aerobic respiration two-component sensor histidine kinase ArcB, partial [Klebsiella pneumoniae]|nr:aerobic respiration two-component sensor histidine kinase ArcB [Klebsiella pneumoniae]